MAGWMTDPLSGTALSTEEVEMLRAALSPEKAARRGLVLVLEPEEPPADVNAPRRRYRRREAPLPAKSEPSDVLRFDGDWVRDPDGSLRLVKKNMRYEKRK